MSGIAGKWNAFIKKIPLTIFCLAAEYGRWNGEDYYENLTQTNCIGTKNMILLHEKFKIRMIFSSSAEVYGDYEGKMLEDVIVGGHRVQ